MRRAADGLSAPARALARFWTALVILFAGGAALLQWLGPPPAPTPGPPLRPAVATAATAAAPSAAPTVSLAASIPPQPSRPIAPPDPALLEPSPDNPKAFLPRIGPNGATSMQVYAASFNPADPRPRIGLVVAGIGLSNQESRTAIDNLPGAVTLAFSPYTPDPAKLLARARAKGHEILVSLPLEPQGYPLNDAGDQSLLVDAPPGQNLRRLDWALSRIQGYVGATGAMDGLYGERFAAAPDLLDTLEHRLAARGLLYVDPRPGKPDPALVAGRTVDVIVDQPPIDPVISANLRRLEAIARAHGSALGLVGWPGPHTLTLVSDWLGTLPAAGFVLAPVTALARPAPTPPIKP
ncbi:MAG: divergent polysaccharide deacetylase family protein [Rhodospirillales bacterium]|nr:divergent polysaccharide deacetylase family protein [Rhodospirillales bacterium]